VQLKLGVPKSSIFKTVTVNGRPAELSGSQKDTVIIATKNESRFIVVGELG
jgi:hypothetical protein